MFPPDRDQQDNHIGFKLYWIPDQPPFVVPQRDDLAQLILAETSRRNFVPVRSIDAIKAGVPLPVFWIIIKTNEALKLDTYNWWRSDQSTKHLAASWILSQPQPKLILAMHPVLWEIFPTMVIGSEVDARIAPLNGQTCILRSDARPTRGILYDWVVNVDIGSCIILFANNQVKVEFSILELRDSSLISLPEFVFGLQSAAGSPTTAR